MDWAIRRLRANKVKIDQLVKTGAAFVVALLTLLIIFFHTLMAVIYYFFRGKDSEQDFLTGVEDSFCG